MIVQDLIKLTIIYINLLATSYITKTNLLIKK